MVESKILGKIATWLLIVLFIVIFIFAFYSPAEGFMGKIAKLALSAERFLPIEPTKEVKQDESLPPSTINTQEAFMNDITSYADKEECMLNLRSLSGLEDSKMEVVNFEGKVISRIEKPVGKEGGIKLNPIDTNDKKLQICTINPEAFYDCYLNEQKKDCKKELFKTLNLIHLTKDSIIIDGNSYTLGQGILFKPKKDKVCFIPVHSSTGDSWYKIWQVFTKWGCDASKGTIDDDCLAIVKNKIPLCK